MKNKKTNASCCSSSDSSIFSNSAVTVIFVFPNPRIKSEDIVADPLTGIPRRLPLLSAPKHLALQYFLM
jgi:hypothetical protein